MDYVRHGEIQGRYLVFFKAHGPVFYHVWHSPWATDIFLLDFFLINIILHIFAKFSMPYIQGPIFFLFAKFPMPYIYSLHDNDLFRTLRVFWILQIFNIFYALNCVSH